jgi:hypothetical protein
MKVEPSKRIFEMLDYVRHHWYNLGVIPFFSPFYASILIGVT